MIPQQRAGIRITYSKTLITTEAGGADIRTQQCRGPWYFPAGAFVLTRFAWDRKPYEEAIVLLYPKMTGLGHAGYIAGSARLPPRV